MKVLTVIQRVKQLRYSDSDMQEPLKFVDATLPSRVHQQQYNRKNLIKN